MIKHIWLVFILIFFTHQINAQKEIVLKKEQIEVKIEQDSPLIKIWILTRNFKRTHFNFYNPLNEISYKKRFRVEYSVTFNIFDGADGYYFIEIINKKEKMRLYFIKTKIVTPQGLKESVEYDRYD